MSCAGAQNVLLATDTAYDVLKVNKANGSEMASVELLTNLAHTVNVDSAGAWQFRNASAAVWSEAAMRKAVEEPTNCAVLQSRPPNDVALPVEEVASIDTLTRVEEPMRSEATMTGVAVTGGGTTV